MVEDGPNNPGMELKLEWLEQVTIFYLQIKMAFINKTGIIGIIEEGAVPTTARGALDTPPHRQKPVVIGITSMVTKLTTA